MKKPNKFLLILTACFFALSLITPSAFAKKTDKVNNQNNSNTSTTTDTPSGATFDGRKGDDCYGFLGLTTWDCGVEITDEDTLKKGIWQIVSNIATDITVIAAYLVLGYVIYGGYLYVFSAGDAGKVASGKKTLAHAFIGLAIVMSAYLIMNTIRFALLGAGGQLNCDPTAASQDTSGCIDPSALITNALVWAYGIAGAVASIFIVYGGISYATSAGDPGKLQKAKQIILYALIGLVVVAFAGIITAFVSGMIRNADNQATNTNTSFIDTNTIIISKEPYDIKTL